jgi:hypothetical protein
MPDLQLSEDARAAWALVESTDDDPGLAGEALARLAEELDVSDLEVMAAAHVLAMLAGAVNDDAGLTPQDAQGVAAAAFDERKHPRIPGGKGGGQFTRKPGGGTGAVPVISGAVIANPEPLREGERMSRDGYLTAEGSAVYQRGLRAGTTPGYDLEPGGAVSDLDHAIAKYTLTADVTAWRGLADNGLNLRPGMTVRDLGYTSLSAEKEKAGYFARWRVNGEQGCTRVGGKPVVLEFTIPAGTHAMPGDSSVREYVLPRGGAYVITGRQADGTLTARWEGASPSPPLTAAAAARPVPAAPAGLIERLAGAPDEITVTEGGEVP